MPLHSLNIRESDMKSVNESHDFKIDSLRIVNGSTNRFASSSLVTFDHEQSIPDRYASVRCQSCTLFLLPFMIAEKDPQVPKIVSYAPNPVYEEPSVVM